MTCLIAACGGDTVKLFDVSVETGDPCSCQYSPSPGSQVNSVKWNHTNLVVASAGEDKKISLWMKNGQNIGSISHSGSDTGDTINESILAISFSSKGSRYLSSGGTGKVVRIWDMQRKRCIKWLKGHTDTITGVIYNNKDEHLASISVKGDLILHNLASGTKVAELKDPQSQVLRVLDSSKLSRHLLVTAGDDGSIHLWDTTGRNPKVSWSKQHSAPTTGVTFSPCNDKMIISVGLDKKLYTFDPGMKKPVHCIPSEAPFSSLAFKDDGLVLAAGTNSGRVVFYDVRGKPQPFTILRAYGVSEAVTSLCWQRSNPISVNESNCTLEVALLGIAGEDSVLMPDPLPISTSTANRTASSSFSAKSRSSLTTSDASAGLNTNIGSTGCDDTTFTPANPSSKASLSRLQTPRSSYIIKDDMEVFSPLVDVQPITPSISNFYDSDDLKKDFSIDRKVAWGPKPPTGIRLFPSIDELKDDNGIPTEHSSGSLQEDISSPVASTPVYVKSPKGDRSPSITPPEAWGADITADRITVRTHTMSRFASRGLLSSSSGLPTRTSFSSPSEAISSSTSDSLNLGGSALRSMEHVSDPGVPALSRKSMVYSDKAHISRNIVSSTPEASILNGGSPRQKRSILENIDDHNVGEGIADGRKSAENGYGMMSDAGILTATSLVSTNGNVNTTQRTQQEPMYQGPPSFALQLVQRTLEESLGAVQKAIHDDVQNLHLELLRQFHILQDEMLGMMTAFQLKQTEMMEEIQVLRKENQELRNLI